MGEKAASARVELDSRTLQRLLKNGQVSASEVKCLDSGSKRTLWKLCLQACRGSTLAKELP